MQQVKVSQQATEFEMKNAVVISELKKVGVWVPSADTSVDHDIADRIRRRLQLIVDLEQQEEEKAKEKKDKKKPVTAKARKSIKQLGKPRKSVAKVEDKEPSVLWARSMKPRKGQASYRKVALPEEETPLKVAVTIEDEPIIKKVEAHISPEVLEKAMLGPTQAELDQLAVVQEVKKKAPAKPPVSPEKVDEPAVAARVAETPVETPEKVGEAAEAGVALESVVEAEQATIAEGLEERAGPAGGRRRGAGGGGRWCAPGIPGLGTGRNAGARTRSRTSGTRRVGMGGWPRSRLARRRAIPRSRSYPR